MPLTRFNGLTRKRASTRKRRTSVYTRARYQRPTAANQKRQIMSNAVAIRQIRSLIPSVYTDWQYTGNFAADISGSPNSTFTILNTELMSPQLWAGVLRQDSNVEEASSTIVRRMQLNLRYALNESNYAQVTTFVVSIRKDAANRIINQSNLNVGEDYIYSTADQFNPRLNSSVFKVHYVRNITMTQNGLFNPAATVGSTDLATSPGLTFAKGQVNMNLNFRLRQPLGTKWRDMDQSQLAPNQRLFLLTFVSQQSDSATSNPPEIDWDAMYTCYNSS